MLPYPFKSTDNPKSSNYSNILKFPDSTCNPRKRITLFSFPSKQTKFHLNHRYLPFPANPMFR